MRGSLAWKTVNENNILSAMDKRSKRKNRTVMVLADQNFFWREYELEEAVEMWESGLSLEYMSEYFNRRPMEVLLLLLHCAEQGLIEWRKGSIFGYAVKTRG